jgi:uncharacterized repeat protein (TIGR02543 family)
MRRVLIIITFALCNIYISIAQQCSYPSGYLPVTVYTPNGSPVTAAVFTGSDPNISPGDIAAWTLYLSQNYGAVYMGDPTYKYNCHGYTWHMTKDNNPTAINSPVWINQGCLSPYINNGGYVACNENVATKVYYHPDGDHSAIRLDSYWYQSKWGSLYLVKHPPNAVDYAYQASKTKTYWKRVSYTGTFNLNGANGTAPSAQTVLCGDYATKPSPDPTPPTGYTFGGWYDNSSCTGNQVNFPTYPITSNKTFYAKWISQIISFGFNIVVNNYSSYNLSNLQIKLYGTIGSSYTFLNFSKSSLTAGASASDSGSTFSLPSNTNISNMSVDFSTVCGNPLRVILAINSASIHDYSLNGIFKNMPYTPPTTTTVSSGTRTLTVTISNY